MSDGITGAWAACQQAQGNAGFEQTCSIEHDREALDVGSFLSDAQVVIGDDEDCGIEGDPNPVPHHLNNRSHDEASSGKQPRFNEHRAKTRAEQQER